MNRAGFDWSGDGNALTPERHRFTGFANPQIRCKPIRGIRQRTVFPRGMISCASRIAVTGDAPAGSAPLLQARSDSVLLLDRAFAFPVPAILK